ncbi:MAG: hypothetical protein L6Q29_04385 [Candidatus Pacebacteria bacterium]|nr:hypothetical protein [Candidatus Paceibacterota bacterium]NUQ57589.1 hypothetical protein [Candidatus Paceibacter sp.]
MQKEEKSEVEPFNFKFAEELPKNLKLERQPSMNDSTTWDPSALNFASDD